MKKIFITLLVSTLSCLSCSDSFLDLPPEHEQTDGTYYITEEHFEQATIGIYEALRAIHDRAGFLMGEQRSDNTHYDRNEIDRGQRMSEEISDFTNAHDNNHTLSMYQNCYSGIARANTVLDKIAGKNFATDFNNRIIGQAKFLRAFFYFNLVRYYGGVPLYLSEVRSKDEAYLPRSTSDQVYTQILIDLEDAIAKLKPVNVPTQDGSASQGAAYMLRAKVLMTKPQRDYVQAEKDLRTIMTMGYDFETNYADVFSTSNKYNKESIFEVGYQQGEQGQESRFLYYFIPRTHQAEVITGVPRSSATLHDGGWNVPSQDLIDSYNPIDKRINASIAVAVGSGTGDDFVPAKVLYIGDLEIANYPIKHYFVNKYRHAHAKDKNTDDNFPVYRYADVYLSLAECLLEQGEAGLALPFVNRVRDRAGLGPLPNVTAENLALERRHEFAFENQRWHDLVRTGKAIEVMTAYGTNLKTIFPYLNEKTYIVTTEKMIFPIPYRERQINKELAQNPGY